jgi:hypothetical protein
LLGSSLPVEREETPGYRLRVVSTLEKVFPDSVYTETGLKEAAISLAQNEFEGFQLIIEASRREVKVKGVRFSDLRGSGNHILPADALSWRRVGYVETAIDPAYPVDRVGLFPDPLMPPGRFTVKRNSRTVLWITVRTRADTPPGIYQGTVTIQPSGMTPSSVPLKVTVWDFALEDEPHLRTLTWLGSRAIKSFYNLKDTVEDRSRLSQYLQNYEDILLNHRLGPGGSVAEGLRKNQATDQFDFSRIDARLERLFSKGMNAFLMGTAPNLKRQGQEHYTPEFIAEFTERLKAFGDHLESKGWIDRAYVYVYDEAPKSAWPEVRKISRAIRAAAPGLRIIQCLNEPEGVRALRGFVDVFDVYITHYHETRLEELQSEGIQAWLAVCCCPADHPNLFIEYPLIDARIIPMFCWKYGVQGFEYWSPNHWARNSEGDPGERWPGGTWDPNTFGKYNGDGYLLYPGPHGVPYPSVRLAALRDGFEDYEYLWKLKQLVEQARLAGVEAIDPVEESLRLLAMEELISDEGDFERKAHRYFAFRRRTAESIVALKKVLSSPEGTNWPSHQRPALNQR